MQKLFIIGNLTKDAELSQTNAGKAFAKFTVAVTRKFTNANGERETDFLNCIAWDKTAETISKYTKKGSKIAVVGEIRTGSYEAKDGTRRYTTDIFVNSIELLSRLEKSEKEEVKLEEIDDDSLPF